jgi:hypothetical protein
MKFLVHPLLVLGLVALPLRTEASPITLVDTLGIATPATQFDVNGTSGPSMGRVNALFDLLFGLLFTLTAPTVITEIGGFVETCLFECAAPLPGRVEIHPAVNGSPDLQNVIATFTLSSDENAAIVSYESVAPGFLLGPGSYYALSAPQAGAPGYVLGSALHPFFYNSGVTTAAQANRVNGTSAIAAFNGGVRVLGDTVPEPSVLLLVGWGLAGLVLTRCRDASGVSH